jgi:hypothetical protein
MRLQRAFVVGVAAWGWVFGSSHRPVASDIPKTWDERALHALEVPAPDPAYTPRAVPADFYYRIPVRPIYRGYPVDAPGKEPVGYFDSLQRRDPEVIRDDARGVKPPLQTEADWIKAGEMVFDAAIFYDRVASAKHVRSNEWYAAANPRLTSDPARLRDDYVPTGFRGYGIKTRAVKGHQFGLSLNEADRTALLAFLKTL